MFERKKCINIKPVTGGDIFDAPQTLVYKKTVYRDVVDHPIEFPKETSTVGFDIFDKKKKGKIF